MADTELTPEEIEATAIGEYKYGFHDEVTSVFRTRRGLDEDDRARDLGAQVRARVDDRLPRQGATGTSVQRPMPTWGADLSKIDFDNIYYYLKPVEEQAKSWDDLPDGMRETWDKLGIPEAEKKYLAGVGAQYESEVVYHNLQKDLADQGVIFLDMDSGLREHEELVRRLLRHHHPLQRQQVRGAQLGRVVGRLVHLRPPGRARWSCRCRPTSASTPRTWASSSGR